jgi:hypothetical protein
MEEGFDFLKGEARLLCEAQYINTADGVRIIKAPAAGASWGRKNSGFLVVAQRRCSYAGPLCDFADCYRCSSIALDFKLT